MASILGGPRERERDARGRPVPSRGSSRYFGLVALIVNRKQSRVPVPCWLLSSIASSDQVALVAFLSPSPLTRLRLSSGAYDPTNGACRPGVAIDVGVWLSNVVSPPEQPANPLP